jgi:hypothetical protein
VPFIPVFLCEVRREQDGHDESCPYERREKQGRKKQGDAEGFAGFGMAW